MNYETQMIEQIKDGNLAGASATHEAWANADFLDCVNGLFRVEAVVGTRLYGQYETYFEENL